MAEPQRLEQLPVLPLLEATGIDRCSIRVVAVVVQQAVAGSST